MYYPALTNNSAEIFKNTLLLFLITDEISLENIVNLIFI